MKGLGEYLSLSDNHRNATISQYGLQVFIKCDK